MAKQVSVDKWLFTVTLLLVFIGLVMVFSASAVMAKERFGSPYGFLLRQMAWAGAGIAAMLVIMNIDYRKYKKLTKPALVGAVLFLVVTLGLGGEVKGATRWLRFGGIGFQPSEFAKYALIFHLCVLLADRGDRIRDFKKGFIPLMIWIGGVTVLVLLQPNFRNGAMIFLISLIMLFVGRARLSHVGLTIGALVPLLLVYMMSAEYRMKRIMSFFNGSAENGGHANYQLWQGIIGFGNGGVFGLGPGQSRQREFFLPESYGDFVFSIVGEEYGLIGTIFILLLFLTILLRGMKIAKNARDDFGRYLAVGITSSITLYALINAGVTLGILPTTGLPMPFVSYGGSAMLFSSVAIGVLLNISSQTDMYPRVPKGAAAGGTIEPVPAVGKVY
jgi:cell division protein FtsW